MGDYDNVYSYYSCLAHDWRSRSEFQGVLNKLRNNVISTKYLEFLPRRVCFCEDRTRGIPDPDDPFDDITDTQLQESWKFVENHLLHKEDAVFSRLQKYLEKLKENIDPDEHKTSAHRFVHILRKALENDFSLLEPPPLLNDPNYQKAKEETYKFAIPNFDKQYLGNLIGNDGDHIYPLKRKYKCKIAFTVEPDKNGTPREQVFVTVTRKTVEREVFKRLEKRIKQHAETVQNKRKIHEKNRSEYEKNKKEEEQKKTSASLNDLAARASTGVNGQNEGGVAEPGHLDAFVPGQKMKVEGTSKTCLTHNDAWGSRLQYVLNQLQTEYFLPNKFCKVFARAVCDCSNLRHHDIEVPECLKDTREQALKANGELTKWKENQQIIKPLMQLLVTNNGSQQNMSILKFAFYFMKAITRDYNDLQKFENQVKEALKQRKQTQLQQPQTVDANAEPSTNSQLTVPDTQNADVDRDTVHFGTEDPLDLVLRLDPASLVNTNLATEDKDNTVVAGTASVSSPTEVNKNEVDEEKESNTEAQEIASEKEICAQKEKTKCFVHDSPWFSLYQYTLNQMHKRNMLPRNKGVKFSSFICTCVQSTETQVTDVDPSQQSSVVFDQRRRCVQIILEGWSTDEPKVFLPLFAAMEKLRQSEIYQSLVKFVFYFNELHNKNTEFLGPLNQGSVDNQHGTASASVAAPLVHQDCMYHGKKWRNLLQYTVNNLYNEKLLKGRERKDFLKQICFCNGQFDFNSHFKDIAEAKTCMTKTNAVISKWERAPRTIEQLYEIFGRLEKGEDTSGGILKFLYYCNLLFDGKFKLNT
ncbi:hypothetical protein ACJMK2_009117 [Sinanodonta woodiana]|uniref:Uncharacterized protein n=1 Tax=Sinanodonta woodiana TaxID=1069815 RepID=A0ABD3VE89_SINWO